ncbi:MAG TPA: glutathione S-transferase family protein [Polyangiales bacterium]|nr:glutathione S-transferase family protein [Polyangiales bacterium]
MTLKLYCHPLASYCWKTLIALYENETPFDEHVVDLMNAQERTAFAKLSPFTKFPLLEDSARRSVIAESTTIIEYLERHYPGRSALIPADADAAFEVRRLDRVFDLYVHESMQKIVGDIIRPAGTKDPTGVEHARSVLATAYDVLEAELGTRPWAAGEAFSMADCAAAPALYYANRVAPLGAAHGKLAAYLERLHRRPSFARVFEEAQPYFAMFPG